MGEICDASRDALALVDAVARDGLGSPDILVILGNTNKVLVTAILADWIGKIEAHAHAGRPAGEYLAALRQVHRSAPGP